MLLEKVKILENMMRTVAEEVTEEAELIKEGSDPKKSADVIISLMKEIIESIENIDSLVKEESIEEISEEEIAKEKEKTKIDALYDKYEEIKKERKSIEEYRRMMLGEPRITTTMHATKSGIGIKEILEKMAELAEKADKGTPMTVTAKMPKAREKEASKTIGLDYGIGEMKFTHLPALEELPKLDFEDIKAAMKKREKK